MSISTSVWHIDCGNVIWKRIVNMAYRCEQNRSASVRDEWSICRLHQSLIEVTINRLLHSSVSLFFPDLGNVCEVTPLFRELQQPQPIITPQKPLIDMITRARHMEMYASDNEVTKRDVYFPWRSAHARGRVITGAFTFDFEIWIMTSLEVESI